MVLRYIRSFVNAKKDVLNVHPMLFPMHSTNSVICCNNTHITTYCQQHPVLDSYNARLFYTSNRIKENKRLNVVGMATMTSPSKKVDIHNMSVKEIKIELQSYGINTIPLYEKHELTSALQKAREEKMLPIVNAMTAMKLELTQEHNETNIDKFLERSELESEFLQKCATIRSNMNSLVFHTSNNNTKGVDSHPTTASSNDVYVELIYDEMKSCCENLSIQEMHTEMEQELRISTFKLLQSCVAIARIDGIIPTTADASTAGDDDDDTKQRLQPSQLWNFLKIQDIVVPSYVNPSDFRKVMMLPSSLSTLSSSRTECIQNEMKALESMSMKNLFNELENIWGISPRCIYVCTLAVLRVLNVIDQQRVDKIEERQQDEADVMNDPELRTMVDTAMANPQIDMLLSHAIMKPHIRNMVMEYIQNPTQYKPNVHDDPELQKILSHPTLRTQMEQIARATTHKNHHNDDEEEEDNDEEEKEDETGPTKVKE